MVIVSSNLCPHAQLLDGREKVMAWLLILVVSLTIGMMLKDVIVSADLLSILRE